MPEKEYTKEEVMQTVDDKVKKMFRAPAVLMIGGGGLIAGLILIASAIKGWGDNGITMRIAWLVLGIIIIPVCLKFARYWWNRE